MPPFAFRAFDLGDQRLLRLVLQRLVEREHEVAPPSRRIAPTFAVRDVAALWVTFQRNEPRLAPERLFVARLQATETVAVDPHESEHRRGERARRVEPLRLGDGGDPGEAEGLDLRRGPVTDLPGDVGERSVVIGESATE